MAEEVLENVVRKVRTLEIKFDDLEGNVLSHGNYFAEIESENEEARKDVEKLKQRVTHVEWDLEPGLSRLNIFKRVSELEENEERKKEKREKFLKGLRNLEKRVGELEDQQEERIKQLENVDREYEEKFRVLNLQNDELRDHLNMTIDAVNNITQALNNVLEQQQQQRGDEVTSMTSTTCEEEEDEKLSLSQVYALYQSQPQDEEGWQEMTNAIKAAEEYEMQKQQDVIMNSLSKDEWEDLLKI